MDEKILEKEEVLEKKKEGRKMTEIPLKLRKENFLVMILLGILLLVVVWPMGDSSKEKNKEKEQEKFLSEDSGSYEAYAISSMKETAAENMTEEAMISYADYLESALEEVLFSMEGVGKVKVMITMESSGEAVLEKDVVKKRAGTTEVDAAGGSRNTTDISEQGETVFTQGEGSRQIPFVKRVEAPKVLGVLVAAEGGQDIKIAKNITEAIQALFDIEAHKIKVVKMNSR